MDSDRGQLDNVTDDDIWPQDDGGGRDSLTPPHRVDPYQEYDEARRLLRDMDDNFYRRRERGFSAGPDSAEPLGHYHFDSSDEGFAALPSSNLRPPVDYVRPSDSSVHRGRSPAYHETTRPPAFESGQFSHGGRSSGSRRARIADRSPPPVSSSRSHDPDFGFPLSSVCSKGGSCQGGLTLGA